MNDSVEIYLDQMYIPMKCPDYKEVDGTLYFMDFRKRTLFQECLFAYRKINGEHTIKDLLEMGCEVEAIEELYIKKYIVLKRNNKSNTLAEDRILIVAPHMDDTAFSCSGYMSKYRNSKTFDIIVMFGIQDYTIYQKYVSGQKYLIEEEKAFWNYQNVCQGKILQYKDGPLRETYDIHSAIGSSATAEEIVKKEIDLYEKIEQEIDFALKSADYSMVILPMGIGNHVDHILVREAGISCCINNGVDFLLYQDFPYALLYGDDLAWVDSEYIQYKRTRVDISDFIDDKIDSIRIYQSQLFDKQVGDIIEFAMQDGCYYENYIKGSILTKV